MKHIQNFDSFYETNANLYEKNNNEELDSGVTLYESIKDRAFGDLSKNEDSLLEHCVDDSFLQDVGDLAQVNESGEMSHLDKTFVVMLETFNAFYSLSLPTPKNPKAIFESLSDWYNENEESMTPESFEQRFTIAVMEEEFNEASVKPTVAEDEAKVDGIMHKEAGTLTPEEFIILSKSRIRARGQASTMDRYHKLHERYLAEIEAQKANGPVEAPRTANAPAETFDNHMNHGLSGNAGRD